MRAFHFDADRQTAHWWAPASRGGLAAQYDLLRADLPDGFLSATCVESDLAATQASDATEPAAGGVFFYLVRAENACASGQGTLGTDSGGDERSGLDCP